MKVYGIAYHSPLDIVSLLPNDIKFTMDTKTVANVCFTKNIARDYRANVQVVFASHRDLVKDSIPILDQGDRGQILNLKQIKWNKFLKG